MGGTSDCRARGLLRGAVARAGGRVAHALRRALRRRGGPGRARGRPLRRALRRRAAGASPDPPLRRGVDECRELRDARALWQCANGWRGWVDTGG